MSVCPKMRWAALCLLITTSSAWAASPDVRAERRWKQLRGQGEDVAYEDVLRNADSVNDLRLNIKLNSTRARNRDLSAGTEHMSIM